MATARRLRQLYDAALATAAVLLGRPDPDVLAAAGVAVAGDASAVATAQGTVEVPEYARALLRGWAGRWLGLAGQLRLFERV